MEKSLAKTDQTSAKAAAEMAANPPFPPARRIGSRSGEIRIHAGCPAANHRKRQRPRQKIPTGQRQRNKKSKTAKGCH